MKGLFRSIFHFRRRILFSVRSRVWPMLFKECAWGLCVYGRINIRVPEKVSVGHHCRMNEGLTVLGTGALTVGSHVHLGGRVVIATSGLEYREENRPNFSLPVHIGDYVWLGAGSCVRPGITIGEGAIVGMGSVVTHDVAPYTVVAGVPARPIATIEHRMSCDCLKQGVHNAEDA